MMLNPPKTVLLVDDDSSVREVLKMALEAWGYGVWVAEDGEEALQITRTRKPVAVLSDVIMPKLDGLGLLRRLKSWNSQLPVILFTAHPTIENAVSAMKEGAADVLTKPIDFRKLQHELEEILENQVETPESGNQKTEQSRDRLPSGLGSPASGRLSC